MKTFILLALVGVSLCLEIHDSVSSLSTDDSESSSLWSPPEFECDSNDKTESDDPNCVALALQTIPEIMIIGQQLVCSFYNHQEDKREEYFPELKNGFIKMMGCLGCGIGSVVGLKDDLEKMGAGAGATTGDVFIGIEFIKGILGIKEPVDNAFCLVLGGLLGSECAHQLIAFGVTGMSENLRKAVCSDNKDLNTEETAEFVRKVACTLDDTVPIDNELERLTKENVEALAPVVKKVISTAKKLPVVDVALCAGVETVDGIVTGDSDSDGDLLGPHL